MKVYVRRDGVWHDFSSDGTGKVYEWCDGAWRESPSDGTHRDSLHPAGKTPLTDYILRRKAQGATKDQVVTELLLGAHPAPRNTAAAVARRRDGRDLAARLAAPWWRLARVLMPGPRS